MHPIEENVLCLNPVDAKAILKILTSAEHIGHTGLLNLIKILDMSIGYDRGFGDDVHGSNSMA